MYIGRMTLNGVDVLRAAFLIFAFMQGFGERDEGMEGQDGQMVARSY